MANGIVLTERGEPVIIGFDHIVEMRKTKTQGTANFKATDLDKDCILITLSAWHGRSIWITDPEEMDDVWDAYQRWVEAS